MIEGQQSLFSVPVAPRPSIERSEGGRAGLRPPARECRECGQVMRTWNEAPLCGKCLEAVRVSRRGEQWQEARQPVSAQNRDGIPF